MKNRFETRYQSGDTPWDRGQPDANLIELVQQWPVPPCRALDIGCGSGDNALWLARNGFLVTGCDIARTAIESARTKAASLQVDAEFLQADFLNDTLPGAPFGFAFDRGCLHTFRRGRMLRRFAARVADRLDSGGLWLSLAGNADGPRRHPGPPRLSARAMAAAVEPFFELLLLKSGRFAAGQEDPPRAWIALMRKRD